MNDLRHLVLFDADQIAGYVFATGRLKEIRGGSRIVYQATCGAEVKRLARQHDPQAKVIFAGGGSGLVRLASGEKAADFMADLKRQYRLATVGGTLSAVKTPYVPGGFAVAVQQSNIALRREKSEYPQHDGQFVANPYTAICVSCGRRPVIANYRTARERVEALCAACLRRRVKDDELHEQAQQIQQSEGEDTWNEQRVTLRDLAHSGDSFAYAFLAATDIAAWNDAYLPNDLEDLGQLSTPNNYLGFIHADGNRMGEHLRSFLEMLHAQGKSDEAQEDAYGAFSRAIADATEGALVGALLRAFPTPPQAGGDRWTPFDNVLLAGDDMILLVAAHQALDVAADFCLGFQERMSVSARNLGYPTTITTAAGVALANAHQPVLYLQRQAKDLYKKAKRLSAERLAQGEDVSTVDFTVVTTPVLRPVEQIREHDYTLVEKDFAARLQLTRRPYTAQDLCALLRLGRRLKGVGAAPGAPTDAERRSYPRSQLHALYEAIFQGYDQASLQGARASLRVSPYQREQLQAFADRFGCNDPLPWSREQAGTRTTAFTDLVEVYDFLHEIAEEARHD